MTVKSAEIFWSAERCLLQYKCFFCEVTFQTHNDCVKHLVKPCEQSPHRAPQKDLLTNDDFYEVLTTHGHIPNFCEPILIKDESSSESDDYVMNMSDEDETKAMLGVDVDDKIIAPDLSITPAYDDDHHDDNSLLRPMEMNETIIALRQKKPQQKPAKKTKYKCDTCGKHSSRKRRLANHLCVLTPDIFTCDFCGKQMFRKSSIVRHMLVHKTQKPVVVTRKFTCEYCGTQMTSLSNLTVHKRIHTGEKPFPCRFCERRFTNSTERKHHELMHTGEQPFKCDQCGRRFHVKQNMMDHIRTVHSDERPIKCETCDRTFKTQQQYKEHQKIHTDERPYNCDVCGKSFRQRSAFQVHMNIHTDHRPYKCSQCDRGFHSTAARRSHEKIFHRLP